MSNKLAKTKKTERLGFRLPKPTARRFKAETEKQGGYSKVLRDLVETYLRTVAA